MGGHKSELSLKSYSKTSHTMKETISTILSGEPAGEPGPIIGNLVEKGRFATAP